MNSREFTTVNKAKEEVTDVREGTDQVTVDVKRPKNRKVHRSESVLNILLAVKTGLLCKAKISVIGKIIRVARIIVFGRHVVNDEVGETIFGAFYIVTGEPFRSRDSKAPCPVRLLHFVIERVMVTVIELLLFLLTQEELMHLRNPNIQYSENCKIPLELLKYM